MKYDDVIDELGELGPYQKRIYFLICLVTIPTALQSMIPLFSLATPDHRCLLPELLNDTYKSQGTWHKDLVVQSVPWDKKEEDFSSCYLFSNNATTGHVTNDTHSCSQWVYSDQIFESTFVSDIDMVCADKSYSTYATMIYMGGGLVGSLFLGFLSDMIGRKKVVMISILGHVIVTFSTAFVTSYVPFIILRFLTSTFSNGIFMAAFVICIELVGTSKRRVAGIVIEFFYTFGLFLLALLAYFIRDWRYLQMATSIPTALLLSLYFVIPESPRWLISNGRYEEAVKILKNIAKHNGVTLSDHVLKFDKMEEEAPSIKIWTMLKVPILFVRCQVLFFNWLVVSLAYFGLSFNVGALSGNLFLNFFLSSLVEGISYASCLILLDRVGRKTLHCFSMLLAGVACLGTMFPILFGGDTLALRWLHIILALIGKFGASAALAIIFVLTAELFPTSMRNSVIGLCISSAQIGAIISPYIADLGKVVDGDMGVALPLIVFGGTSVVAGLLALSLPETKGRVLPESMEDTTNFGRKDTKSNFELDGIIGFSNNDKGKLNSAYSPDKDGDSLSGTTPVIAD